MSNFILLLMFILPIVWLPLSLYIIWRQKTNCNKRPLLESLFTDQRIDERCAYSPIENTLDSSNPPQKSGVPKL